MSDRPVEPYSDEEFKRELLAALPHLRAFARGLSGRPDFADSVFAWELTANTTGRGINYDAVNVGGTLGNDGGSGAVFKAVLTTGSFSGTFWQSDRSWTDIFKNTAEDTNLAFADLFSSFEYWEGGTNVTGTIGTYGNFSITGNTLTWDSYYVPIPEPSSALAGLLLTAGLLRRRRKD